METILLHNEKDLIQGLVRGDETAFRKIYDHYRKKVYALGLFITKSENQAQELVQDVFSKVWEKRDQLAEINYFNSWLRTVARNTAINYLRARAVEKLGLAHITMGGNRNCLTEDEVADREYSQLLETAIRSLPPQQQKVYILHRQQGLSHEIIAGQLQISVLTSRKYMKLALHSIRVFLEHRMEGVVGLAIYCCFT